MQLDLAPGVLLTPREVEEAPVFKEWASRLNPEWRMWVTVNAADAWGGEIHMLQLTVAREGRPWPVTLTLRSETVDILTIVTDGTHEWVVFVEQEREASGGLVVSNPAGGCNWNEGFQAAAQRELKEELGLDDSVRADCSLLVPRPVLASPGVTNERVYMMRAVVKVAGGNLEQFLAGLRGRKTGVTAEGEDITLVVVAADEARRFIENQADPDAKTLLALALAGL